MSEGIGSPEFTGIFAEHDSLDAFMRAILETDYFVRDQWQVEELAKVCRRAKVRVVTDGLPPETLRQLFVEPAESVEAAVAAALEDHGPDATIAVIPEGPYVMGAVKSDE